MAGDKRAKQVEQGAERGHIVANAAALARELANTPPTYLNAKDIAERAVAIGAESGLTVEVFNKDQLEQLGCGGLLGVNRGSVEPPRMVKLTYSPRNPTGHLALVGKGIMYDSGGISLKGGDAFHQIMKMDMSGAAAVLSTMSALKALRCKTKVTAYLMCTDNMPSGSAVKLGDVLTMRNGKTVEVLNTDAEGRLVLADGLSLAAELEPDAIVDIATLTGACLTALGTGIAGLLGNHQGFIDQVEAVSENVDEPVWQLPLATKRYRKLLDSNSADMKNIGGPYGGTIIASIFLNEFVDGRAVGAPRHRRPDERRRRRRHLLQGRHRLRHAAADRSRLQLHTALSTSATSASAEVARRTMLSAAVGSDGVAHAERDELVFDDRWDRRRRRTSPWPAGGRG